MSICNEIFTLDDINIVGGDYKEFPIHIQDKDRGGLLSTANLSVNFSIVQHSARYGAPLLTKDLEVSPTDSTAFLLILMPEDTRDLSGKYIYQLSIKAPNEKQESFQGIMRVDKNLNPSAFSATV